MATQVTYASNKLITPKILIGSGPNKVLFTGSVLSATQINTFLGNVTGANVQGTNIRGDVVQSNLISGAQVVAGASFFTAITASNAVILSGTAFGTTVFDKITATELTVLTSTTINFETTIFNFGTAGALSADEITAFSFVTAGAVYANNLLTDDWNLTYSIVQANSGENNWAYRANDVKSLTGNWQNAYTAVQTNSSGWIYQGTDLKTLTGNYEVTYSLVAQNSTIWGGEALRSLSGNWQDTWTVVRANSGDSWSYRANDIKALTGKYEGISTTVANNSAAWGGTILAALSSPWEYTTSLVRDNSATAWAYQGTDVKLLTSKYENLNTVVAANSSGWNRALSSTAWNDAVTVYQNTSASYVLQGGNSPGTDLTIGSNNSRNVILETNGSARVYISTTGSVGIGTGTSTPAGTLDIQGSVVETRATPVLVGNSLTLNLATANFFVVNLNANITSITIQNTPAAGKVHSFVLQLQSDGNSRTVVWPLGLRWPNGIAPTITNIPGKVDTFTFVTHDGGTNYYGFISGQNAGV